MTGETLRELLKPLMGKAGSLYVVIRGIGQIGLPSTPNNKLTSVDVRSDGLVRIERETGWTVIDPDEVVATGWNGDSDHSAGQFL
jgi:hypothetical protein